MREDIWAGRVRESSFSLWVNQRHRAVYRDRLRVASNRWRAIRP